MILKFLYSSFNFLKSQFNFESVVSNNKICNCNVKF